MVRVGIVGGTGYTGAELLRILAGHPEAELCAVTSRGDAGTRVDGMFPNLRGHCDLEFTDPASGSLDACDIVFFATPHATAMASAAALLDAGKRVIDLSADFRLRDETLFEKWYGVEHAAPALLADAVYGLPEINREEIRDAELVACPGCYPTAVTLALLPLIEAAAVDPDRLIADAKSGVSGAGRSARVGSLFVEAGDSFKAYGIDGHRHLPEIQQTLSAVAGQPVQLTFVPHLVPMLRGIEATLYAELTVEADLQSLFEKRYAEEPFVDVMPAGSHPETRSVRGSNVCRLAVHAPSESRHVVVSSVIDNLVKGAAGQAIQNMNLMLGLDESTGLSGPGLLP